MSTENIEDHKALACPCGSVNYSLLKSGWIECNKCQDRMGHWLTSPVNPVTEFDVRTYRIKEIESLKTDKKNLFEVVEHIAHICTDAPDVLATIPEPKFFSEIRRIKKMVNQTIKVINP